MTSKINQRASAADYNVIFGAWESLLRCKGLASTGIGLDQMLGPREARFRKGRHPSISLATINGAAPQELRETGSSYFELPEILFDLDFPGQAVRVTIFT